MSKKLVDANTGMQSPNMLSVIYPSTANHAMYGVVKHEKAHLHKENTEVKDGKY